jgi:hypothetical protein
VGCCDGSPLTSPNFEQLADALAREGIEHNFYRDGWTDFDAVTMTAHGSQAFTTSVDSRGRGVVTGVNAGNGSHRVAYLRDRTDFADQEITSVIWGPTADWDGTNAQQGHLHRVRQIGPTTWEGIAIWTSIVFGGDYSWLHVSPVRWDGVTLLFGTGPASGNFEAADVSYVIRTSRVLGFQRFNFISWFNTYTMSDPRRLEHLETGDIVTISSLADATFNETNIPLSSGPSIQNALVTVVEPSSTSAVAYTPSGGGDVAPSGVDLQKRYTPMVLCTRVVGGTAASAVVQGKRWRLGEPVPDWTDARVQRGIVTPSANVPTIPTDGQCGLWAAHFHDGSGGAWGDLRFRCVAPGDCH